MIQIRSDHKLATYVSLLLRVTVTPNLVWVTSLISVASMNKEKVKKRIHEGKFREFCSVYKRGKGKRVLFCLKVADPKALLSAITPWIDIND